jgi:hypothetical protein
MVQNPRKRSNLQPFLGKGYLRAINALQTHRCPWIWVISSCAKDMAKLMGWSTLIDLGHDAVDLGS